MWDLRRDRVRRQVVAVALCGSAARGEERWQDGHLVSDLDIMVVTRTASPFVGRRIAAIMSRYRPGGLEGGQVPLSTLREHRTLLNYEARLTGVVLEGDPDVLQRIPMQFPTDIPRWEAVRLLLNRLMEHVKLRAQESTPELVTSKTYEALSEAFLAIDQRYQPTYRARLAELERGPQLVLPGLHPKLVGALHDRLASGTSGRDNAPQALSDLRDGLAAVLHRFLGEPRPLQLALDRLTELYRHIEHRLYWTAREAALGRVTFRTIREDPCITIWRRGLELLDGTPSVADAKAVVRSWERCPQILDART